MNDQQMRINVAESMASGAAKILDRSRIYPKDELVAIAVKAQSGDSHAYTDLVDGMTQFVFREAYSNYRAWRSHLAPQASFDDVFAAGLEGLQRAITKFDPAKGYAVTTHSKQWIRNACQRCIFGMIGMARISERTLREGVTPSDPLLTRMTLSLDYEDLSTGRLMHEDVPAAAPQVDAHYDVEMMRGVLDILYCVDPRLPEIVKLLQCEYGYREIGRIVGISADRVRQLQKAGAEAVERSGIADEYLD